MCLNDLLKSECFRSSVCNCKHIHAECVFKARLFIKHIFSDFLHLRLFFNSNTIRIPSLEDWFEISVISVVFFVSTRPATSFKNLPYSRSDHRVWDLCDHKLLLAAF